MLLHDGGDPPHLRQRFGTLPAGEKRLRFEPAYGLHEPVDGLQERLQFAGEAERKSVAASSTAVSRPQRSNSESAALLRRRS